MPERAPEACPGPKRVRYFSGQLLSADDFNAEQDYFRGKQKTLNRLLLGYESSRASRRRSDEGLSQSAPGSRWILEAMRSPWSARRP